MLWNRSRSVTSKQALMSDQTSSLSPTITSSSPISSFLNSPRFFNGFLSKTAMNAETMSPTSILDSKNSTDFANPFGSDRALSEPRTPTTPSPDTIVKEAIGLAIIDPKFDEDDCRFSKAISRVALLGSKLKVKIPEVKSSSISPVESPSDFGIKTRSSQLLSSPFGSSLSPARQMSLKEMEMSEDYTCVITHGPNPKTIHIYDDCIVETSCFDVDDDDDVDDEKKRDEGSEPTDFLSFCHSCKAVLEDDKDIYMYRGEKAFCSHECRCQEMIFEGMENRGRDFA